MRHTEQQAPQGKLRHQSRGLFHCRDVLWACLMAALVVGGYTIIRRVPMSVQRVVVYGPFQSIQRDQVRKAVEPYVSQDLLWFPVASLRTHLLAELPWLKAVRVVRVWPPGIRLYLTERQAVAYWGDHRLLSASGAIFQAPQPWPQALPHLTGPSDQASRMVAFYEQAMQHDVVAQHIQSIYVTPRHAWLLKLDDGALLRLGRSHVEQRWRRFCQVYRLFAEQQDVPMDVVFDFRYPNGFSLGSQSDVG